MSAYSQDELRQRRARLSPENQRLLEQRLRGQKNAVLAPDSLRRAPEGEPAPVSFPQQRLWLLHHLDPTSPAYNLPMGLRLSGALDEEALRRSLEAVIQRHASLRTAFASVDGQPVQRVAPVQPVPLPTQDLRALPEPEREAEVLRRMREEGQQPFPPLEKGPLMRAALLKLASEEHVLLVTMHHIVSDGWSFGVLIRELAALYQAFSRGQPSPLPELPVQYPDFSRWQRERMQGPALEAQLGWWKRRLAGAPAVLELPTDRPRRPVQGFAGASRSLLLPLELTESLKALGRREGATLFMTLLAAFQTLLHRYTRQDDILVGSPVANRQRPEFERLIGFFVNTLVHRADLSGQPTFLELLARVREGCLGALAHQDLPFERLVEELRPQRDMSHTPLFQVLFALQNAPTPAVEVPGLRISALEGEVSAVQFDLTLVVVERDGGLEATLAYKTELFEADTAVRMLSHWRTLLEAVVAAPERRLPELPLMPPEEERRVLVEWNRTTRGFPLGRTAVQLIEEQAARLPDALAVVCEGDTLTYRQLERRANQLARLLRQQGVGPEQVVSVCLERSADMVVALLGVLKAGGAWMPLDPATPPARMAALLADAHARVVLTQPGVLPDLPETVPPVISLDSGALDAWSAEPLAPAASPENLCYVIYTSGTTGHAKGVMVSHGELCNQLHWRRDALKLGEGDRVLHSIPFTFDPSVWGFLGPLAVGARLLLTRPRGHQDSLYLKRLVAEHAATVLDFAMPTLQALLQEPGVEELTSVRHVFCGGEALPPDVVQRFFERLPRAALFNQYGPTETVIDATAWPCQPEDAQRATIPIGRPVANKRLYVLDRHLRPVPPGVPGELYVGGVGLARGYLGQPQLTAERFIPDPFSPEPGARMYQTGDAARFLADGSLEFLGRLDRQVKLRGFRIELGEVEATLARHPEVREVVVMARELEGQAGGRVLVAYVVSGSGSQLAARELRQFLKAHLPDYMVPSAFVLLPALPLNANGKVDRNALPAPTPEGLEVEADDAAPRTATEEVIAEVWAQLLGRRRVGIHTSFFDLGGHSLLATRVVSRLRELLEVELPLRELFEAPTVAGLAERVEAALRAGRGLSTPPLTQVPRNSPLPLSYGQQRLWRMERVRPGTAAEVVPLAVRVRGPLDATALTRSVEALVHRHEVLRTTFVERNGEPFQHVEPPAPLSLPWEDLRGLRPAEREAEAQRLAKEEAHRPFDLSRGPLLRGRLVRLADEEHLVLLSTHRIAYDGWSLGVLLREVAALYAALREDRPSPLPGLPVQYADFASWQRQWLASPKVEGVLSYWRQQLAGVPPLELPTDHPREGASGTEGSEERVLLPTSLVEALETLRRDEGATLFMTLLTAFQAVLSRRTGQQDLLVGTPVAWRPKPELEGLLGRFVNLLLLRGDLSGTPTFRQQLRRTRSMALAAYAHQDIPFERLVEELGLSSAGPDSPPIRAMFNLVDAADRTLEVAGLTFEPSPALETSSEVELTLHAQRGSEGVELRCIYRTALFDAPTIRGLLEEMRALLEDVVVEPERSLAAPSRHARLPRRPATRKASGRIAVMGAGLTGTLLAAYLARRGYEVDVFERHADPRLPASALPPGVRATPKPTINLTLAERGLRALDAIGVGEQVRRHAVPVYARVAHAVDGTLSRQPYGNSGEALHSILRGELIKVLLDFAGQQEGITFHFNERCVEVNLESATVELRNTLSGAITRHSADRLLGADGAFSAVRMQLQRTSRFSLSQHYLDCGYKELTAPAREPRGWTRQGDALHFWPRGQYMLMGAPNLDGSFTVTLYMPFEGKVSFESLKTEADVLRLFEESFPDALPELPDLTQEYFSRPHNSLVTIRCAPWSFQEKVGLLGDAAHAIVPFYGQGANAGFEDCAVLDALLDQHADDWATVLPTFERLRKPNTDTIADLAIQHRHELQDWVGDPSFRLRKEVERRVHERHSGRYASLYWRVAFTTTPYLEAVQREREQRGLIDRILSVPGVETLGGEALDTLIDRMVRDV